MPADLEWHAHPRKFLLRGVPRAGFRGFRNERTRVQSLQQPNEGQRRSAHANDYDFLSCYVHK